MTTANKCGVKVQIFLNEGKGHFFGFKAFSDVPELHKAYEFEISEMFSRPITEHIIMKTLEWCFEEFNVGGTDYAHEYRARGNRSLSVGDVVVVGEAAYACENVGWKRITTDELIEFIAREKK